MSKKFSVITAVICAFVFAAVAIAEDAQPAATAAPAIAAPAATPATTPAKPPVKTSVTLGDVVSVDATANQIVVKTEGKGQNITFDVTAKTNIRKAGKEAALSEIAAGDNVIVAFKKKDDKRTATSNRVRNPKVSMPASTPVPAAPSTPAAPVGQ